MNYGPTFADQSSGYLILNMALWSNPYQARAVNR